MLCLGRQSFNPWTLKEVLHTQIFKIPHCFWTNICSSIIEDLRILKSKWFGNCTVFLVVFCGQLASLVAQTVKNLPTMQETQVRSPTQEDPLDKEMATHSSYCLENPMDRGAWWATVHGVTKSWTWLSDFTHSLTHKCKKQRFIMRNWLMQL